MVPVGIYAYKALTAEVEVTVSECLSFVGPDWFEVALYPGENDTAEITVANASSVSIEVELVSTVTPDPGPKGLTVSIPNKITAPAQGQITFNIGVSANNSVEPGVYRIMIDFER